MNELTDDKVREIECKLEEQRQEDVEHPFTPCPICGNKEPILRDQYGSTMWDVCCDMCCTSGLFDEEEQAVKAWNNGVVHVPVKALLASREEVERLDKALRYWGCCEKDCPKVTCPEDKRSETKCTCGFDEAVNPKEKR